MFAEIVLDLPSMGDELGDVLERDLQVFPSLNKIADMWAHLGIEVSAFHVIAPGTPSTNTGDSTFSELHMNAWWEAEQIFIEDRNFTVELRTSPSTSNGTATSDALVVSTALARSDALSKIAGTSAVIVMSNRPSIAPAVTHARGATVLIAGTVVPDPSLAHLRLDREWLVDWANRLGEAKAPDVELRDGRPWVGGAALGTPYDGVEGRDLSVATLPSFAESAVLFDPGAFSPAAPDTAVVSTPEVPGIATVVERLGFGELVHVESIDAAAHPDTVAVASLYRLTADHPEAPVLVASTRASIVAATSDLATFDIANRRRLLRLCLPDRPAHFEEHAFDHKASACRTIVEGSLSELLFPASDVPVALDADTTSPILTLWTNPNTAKSEAARWRSDTQRRFLLIGADGMEGTPADSNDGPVLPISIGGCTDFALRPPNLRPGCVVEAVLSADRTQWVVVSDPIERRRKPRESNASTAGDSEMLHAA